MKPSPAALKLAEKILRHLYGEFFHANDLRDVPELATLIDESNKELVRAAEVLLDEAHSRFDGITATDEEYKAVCGMSSALANHQPQP